MNRRSANAYESEDSASDWDTTVAESPDRINPPPLKNVNHSADADYATVVPRARSNLKAANVERSSKSTPLATPRKGEIANGDHYSSPSPPPHLSTFKNALTAMAKSGVSFHDVVEVITIKNADYSEASDRNPELPPRTYDGKGQMYTVPSNSATPAVPAVTVNWDDSDADEQILRELRQNFDKEKQKQEAKQQEALAQENIGASSLGAENQGYNPSPLSARSQKSGAEKRFYDRKEAISTPRPKLALPVSTNENKAGPDADISYKDPRKKKQAKKREETREPMIVRDLTGKKCIYYFEEGSHHLLEVVEDDADAFLPEKIEEIERLFKRVWREIFSILRVITSFFVLFATELVFYLIHSVFQPLVLDTLAAIGNHLVKPLMTIIFNHMGQPIFALVWNILNAFVLAVNPLMQLLTGIVKQAALLLQSVRLFQINFNQSSSERKIETV